MVLTVQRPPIAFRFLGLQDQSLFLKADVNIAVSVQECGRQVIPKGISVRG